MKILLLSLALLSVEPKAIIKTQATVPVGSTIILDARASVSDRPLVWKYVGPDVPFITFDKDDRKGVFGFVPSAPGGVYKFTLIAKGKIGDDLDADADIAIVKVESPDPTPIPQPTPKPIDPVPKPTIDPVPAPPVPPTPTDKLRVVLVYESSDKMSAEQLNIINSTGIRSYLSSRCMPDGNRPAWRVWDKDTDASKETLTWQSAWTLAKADSKPLPKFVIFAGDKLISAPLPSSEADALELLKSYGGH